MQIFQHPAPQRTSAIETPSEARRNGRAAGFEQGRKEGAERERARCKAILTAPEAQGRPSQALALATHPGLDAEAARKLLATLPAEQPAARVPTIAEREASLATFDDGPVPDADSPWADVIARINREGRANG